MLNFLQDFLIFTKIVWQLFENFANLKNLFLQNFE